MHATRLPLRFVSRLAGCAVLVLLATVASSGAARAGEPKAAKKKASGRPADPRWALAIPRVPRDQVIGFALYTVHVPRVRTSDAEPAGLREGILKLSAILYPLDDGEERKVSLEIEREGAWMKVAEAPVNPEGWMATFRVEGWDSTRDARYRVVHAGGARYEGRIRRDPLEKDEIVVALFTGNSNSDRGPRDDIVRNVTAQDPDLLFFSGDQSYDHKEHTAAWLLFGRQFGEIIRDRPTVSIPDDHDVGQGNLWGEAGGIARAPGADDGGYLMPPAYVNMVERAQTSHLPDPYDPTPVKNGIGVYYTSLAVGGIDFAIIEDRKWKTGPNGLVPQQGPRPDHVTDPGYDPDSLDLPEAVLLGERQLRFLREWGQDWTGATMKVVLSQTIFAGGAHLHGSLQNRLIADLDSNGWPRSGRERALREIRRCFAFMMGGDQHLATAIHHGINEWEDSGWSFGCPSIWNYYGRWWWPLEPPVGSPVEPPVGSPVEPPAASRPESRLGSPDAPQAQPSPGPPLEFTGRYHDGFRNKITMRAYANPAEGNHRAAGYGLVRFRKPTREITMECWPRFADVTAPGAAQYPGWPITIRQEDNYGRRAMAYLPRLEVKGREDPVVRIVHEDSGEIAYTLRIKGTSFRPKVFIEGVYTIEVGEGDRKKIFGGIRSVKDDDPSVIEVELDGA